MKLLNINSKNHSRTNVDPELRITFRVARVPARKAKVETEWFLGNKNVTLSSLHLKWEKSLDIPPIKKIVNTL